MSDQVLKNGFTAKQFRLGLLSSSSQLALTMPFMMTGGVPSQQLREAQEAEAHNKAAEAMNKAAARG